MDRGDTTTIETADVNPLVLEAKELAACIGKALGIKVPLDQLIFNLNRGNRRLKTFSKCCKTDHFSNAFKKGFRIQGIEGEPRAFWLTYYTSLDLECRRKTHIEASKGSYVLRYSVDETIMEFKLEDKTRRRIMIIKEINPDNLKYTITELELEN